MVAHYDRVYLQAKLMFVEGGKVVDRDALCSLAPRKRDSVTLKVEPVCGTSQKGITVRSPW